MILKRIELVNYCQHERVEIEVSGNLIAVVGHNGVGKSNFLGAIQFALTGEQPGKNKADLLHWGAKDGHVAVEFVQDGKPGRIERSVSSNKVTLEYDGETTSGITNVAKVLEERLRLDKDIVRQSVFVRQAEVDAIISAKTDRREREVAFQRLLGLDAAKIHKTLTDWMYTAVKPVSYDIQLTDATKRLGELEARKAELDEAVSKAASELEAFGDVTESSGDGIAKCIAAIASVLSAKSEVAACEQAAADRKATLETTRAANADAGENPGVDMAEQAEKIAALRSEVETAVRREKAEAASKEADRCLAEVEAAAHPSETDVAKADAEARTRADELAALSHDIGTRTKAVGVLSGGESTCPVCGKPLDEHAVGQMRTELRYMEEKAGELASRKAEADKAAAEVRKEYTEWNRREFLCRNAANQAKATLDATPESMLDAATAQASLDAETATWRRQKAYDELTAGHAKATRDAELRLEVAEKALLDARSRLVAAEEAAVAICGREASADWTQAKLALESVVAEADSRRRRHTELRTALASVTSTRDEVARTLATLQGTVKSLKEAQAEQDLLAKRLATLERVRDWFHYGNGPRILVTQVMAALTGDVNRFLGNFTAPFVVEPDEDQVGFRVDFTDGRARPETPPGTDVLSGGERVQLAVAFRLAIYCMFAGKLGLLSLDEPTAYLDDGNVDRFGVLLGKVREIARNMNTQVFMATHERAVIPHMDAVIDLN